MARTALGCHADNVDALTQLALAIQQVACIWPELCLDLAKEPRDEALTDGSDPLSVLTSFETPDLKAVCALLNSAWWARAVESQVGCVEGKTAFMFMIVHAHRGLHSVELSRPVVRST